MISNNGWQSLQTKTKLERAVLKLYIYFKKGTEECDDRQPNYLILAYAASPIMKRRRRTRGNQQNKEQRNNN